MAVIHRTVVAYECDRCDHQWQPRIEAVPKRCPACKSQLWNQPRVRAKGGGRKPKKPKGE
jgi:predicted Zn-ribbon and HTH transcriptional regulator